MNWNKLPHTPHFCPSLSITGHCWQFYKDLRMCEKCSLTSHSILILGFLSTWDLCPHLKTMTIKIDYSKILLRYHRHLALANYSACYRLHVYAINTWSASLLLIIQLSSSLYSFLCWSLSHNFTHDVCKPFGCRDFEWGCCKLSGDDGRWWQRWLKEPLG